MTFTHNSLAVAVYVVDTVQQPVRLIVQIENITGHWWRERGKAQPWRAFQAKSA